MLPAIDYNDNSVRKCMVMSAILLQLFTNERGQK